MVLLEGAKQEQIKGLHPFFTSNWKLCHLAAGLSFLTSRCWMMGFQACTSMPGLPYSWFSICMFAVSLGLLSTFLTKLVLTIPPGYPVSLWRDGRLEMFCWHRLYLLKKIWFLQRTFKNHHVEILLLFIRTLYDTPWGPWLRVKVFWQVTISELGLKSRLGAKHRLILPSQFCKL